MSLTDSQIERYSRQIIIPKFGPRAQERLLASRVLLAGKLKDTEQVAAYLAGAGVGRIDLELTSASEAGKRALAARIEGLNPDVALTLGAGAVANPSLFGALISDAESLALALKLNRALRSGPTAAARLDAMARLVILADRPPCFECVEGGLSASPAGRSRNAGFIAMVFAAEIIKMLALEPVLRAEATMTEFDGFVTRLRGITAAPSCLSCRRPN